MKVIYGLACGALLTILSIQAPVFAKNNPTTPDIKGKQRYIVLLDDLPLSTYDGRTIQTPERSSASMRMPATANRFTPGPKLDVNSDRSKRYLRFLDDRFEHFRGEARLRLGRQLRTTNRYRYALNGFATELNANEVEALRHTPGVKAIHVDKVQRLHTDSGPAWIGADKIHDGFVGFPASGGEGVVVGIIDTGINWDHPSFTDPGEGVPPGPGRWDHQNPLGTQLGLCSKAEVLCNDKLIGVYDFVVDDPQTEEVEENTDGKDNLDHGSLVASIVAGNPVSAFGVFTEGALTTMAGVAPNANIVSYRVCYLGDPADPGDDGCLNSATLSAIDQAIADGVDVINYSIGSDAYSPWLPGTPVQAFLNAREAGILVVTSSGNAGPNASSIGVPANAPWVLAVGAATHDRITGNMLENLTGGDSTPPPALAGASLTNGIGIRNIVHAKDYGNALCGTGVSEPFGDCTSLSGSTNPFGPNTFDGEIVVCDRGEYGRVEKGKNVMLAGAGGFVLANTDDPELQDVVADEHCLPGTHLGYQDSELLRNWLETGVGHQGSISDSSVSNIPEAGDILARFSSRGPNSPPVENLLKPELIAPGVSIIGASSIDNNLLLASGTSFSSPFVAGGAALLLSVHTDWTPPMLASALTMTATPELAIDYDDSPATPHKRGAGRPRLERAINAGLYLDETNNDFIAANPNSGGDPGALNMPGLVETACHISCNFQRTVTDLVGGATWTATDHGFAEGVDVTVTPSNFTLANGGSQPLTINIDLSQSSTVGNWVYGEVVLASNGLPDMVFTVAVYSDGGELPIQWQINSDQVSSWREFALSDLVPMPDATFTSAGLVEPTLTTELLIQDPTDDLVYDSSAGIMTVWHTVPEGTLLLRTETMPTTAIDVDLYVGLDANNDGIAQEEEQLCSSTAYKIPEVCDLFTPVAGTYWVIVQNWEASENPDEVTLRSAVVAQDSLAKLTATGDGMIPGAAPFSVRVSWDNVKANSGTELIGAVGLGTDREFPNNIGVIPVIFTKTDIADPQTLVLMNGVTRGLAMKGKVTHDLAYIDVPPDTETLTVTANGANEQQNNNLVMNLYRMDFDDAFAEAPFAVKPNTGGAPLASATGSGDMGPSIVLNGGVVPGRWYVVLTNDDVLAANVEVTADLVFSGTPISLRGGLWEPGGVREGIKQGYDYSSTGSFRSALWYSFKRDGTPTWYLAAGPEPVGNVWVAKLKRFTNDGSSQKKVVVGHVSVTALSEDEQVFSFILFGEEGSDRIFTPFHPVVCPVVEDSKKSYNGVWSRPAIGVGGATVMVNDNSQGYVHYIYDGRGNPKWLQGANASPESNELALRQWSGFCPVCTGPAPTRETVGVFTRDFVDEESMNWNLDYVLAPPLTGAIDRSDGTAKLTVKLDCQ